MNRCNILKSIDLLQFCINVNQTMIKGGQALTGKSFTEEEILELESEIHAATDGIQLLEEAVREDKAKEEASIKRREHRERNRDLYDN